MGTQYGGGCTSQHGGHGLCNLSQLVLRLVIDATVFIDAGFASEFLISGSPLFDAGRGVVGCCPRLGHVHLQVHWYIALTNGRPRKLLACLYFVQQRLRLKG